MTVVEDNPQTVDGGPAPRYDRDRIVDLASYELDVWKAFAKVVMAKRPPEHVLSGAACKGMPVELFVPSARRINRADARAVCRSCPVANECRDWARAQGPSIRGTYRHEGQAVTPIRSCDCRCRECSPLLGWSALPTLLWTQPR